MTPHYSVMLEEVLEWMAPEEGKKILDCTFGAGGYSRAFLNKGATVIATDRDPDASAYAQQLHQTFSKHFFFHQIAFSEIENFLEPQSLDGIILDLGVSSMQLDQAHRGFSFRFDGPLDMRMQQEGLTAADIVNQWEEGELLRIFRDYGEERRARYFSRLIVNERKITPIMSSTALADLIYTHTSPRDRGIAKIHPATRIFQALRIAVNDELRELELLLEQSLRLLKTKAVLGVVTFHSLEDRIVKNFLKTNSSPPKISRYLPESSDFHASFSLPFTKPKYPTRYEIDRNNRSRSAKLRIGIRER